MIFGYARIDLAVARPLGRATRHDYPETMDQTTAPQPTTFTRRAGLSGLRLGWANVRHNWLRLVFVILVWGGYQLRINGWSDGVAIVGWSLGGVFVFAVLFYGLHGLSTIRLTRDELVVTRFGVRQRLPRDEVGDLVRGRAYPNHANASQEVHYRFITDVRGQRFAAIPEWSFPDSTFEDLAVVLGVESRPVTGPAEERRLSPWWMRSLWLTTLVSGVALVVLVALVWWASVALKDWLHARAETAAQETFVAQVEPQLTTSRFPHLDLEDQGAPASPLSVSAYAETSSEVRLRSWVKLVGTNPELSSAEAIELLDIQCAASTEEAEVTVSQLGYESDGVFGYDRYVELACASDPSDVHDWLTWSEQHPADQDAGSFTVTQRRFSMGEQLDLEIVGYAVDASDKAFRATMEHMCAFPGADETTLRVYDRDRDRRVFKVRCGSIEEQLAE